MVQRQILPRSSVTVGYYRRQFGNFTVNDNLAVGPDDYSPYCITAPVGSAAARRRRHAGVRALRHQSQSLFGQGACVVRRQRPVREQEQVYDGVNLTQSTRFSNGATVQGGVSSGGRAPTTATSSTRRSAAVLRRPAAVAGERLARRLLSAAVGRSWRAPPIATTRAR